MGNITLVELDVKLQKILNLMEVLRTQEEKILEITEAEASLDALIWQLIIHKKKIAEEGINGKINKEQVNEKETNEEPPKQQSLTDKTKLHKFDQENSIVEENRSRQDKVEE